MQVTLVYLNINICLFGLFTWSCFQIKRSILFTLW